MQSLRSKGGCLPVVSLAFRRQETASHFFRRDGAPRFYSFRRHAIFFRPARVVIFEIKFSAKKTRCLVASPENSIFGRTQRVGSERPHPSSLIIKRCLRINNSSFDRLPVIRVFLFSINQWYWFRYCKTCLSSLTIRGGMLFSTVSFYMEFKKKSRISAL